MAREVGGDPRAYHRGTRETMKRSDIVEKSVKIWNDKCQLDSTSHIDVASYCM